MLLEELHAIGAVSFIIITLLLKFYLISSWKISGKMC